MSQDWSGAAAAGRVARSAGSGGDSSANGGGAASGAQVAGTSVATVEVQAGDKPLARFGHTTTHVGHFTVVLFGGAVGDSGKYQITNDLYGFDMSQSKWLCLKADNCPSPRAAHAAACVDSMQFVVYGGATGGGSLSTDELYLLDLRKPLSWLTVPITGQTPGRRYGHTMVYHKPNLIVFGGNDGQRSVNDIWFMDVEKSPFSWVSVSLPAAAKQPVARVYHSADICPEGPASGMMVVFGGRTTDSKSLRDTWGLRQHRDGRWDWVEAPTKKGNPPEPRFQHSSLFIGSKMVVIGGRDCEMARPLPTAVYDTETCEWRPLPSMGRFRHSSWAVDNVFYTFGGFDHRTQTHPTADLQSLDVSTQPNFFSESSRRRTQPLPQPQPPQPQPPANPPPGIQQSFSSTPSTPASPPRNPAAGLQGTDLSRRLGGKDIHRSPYNNNVRMSEQVFLIVDSPDFSALVRKISIDRLEEEGKKIRGHASHIQQLQPVPEGDTSVDRIIRRLLRPNLTPVALDRDYNSQMPFCLAWDDVSVLCLAVLKIMRQESMVLQLRAPIKVYGDIHGQYYDLMRLFGSYKCPVYEDWLDKNDPGTGEGEVHGDIDSIDYLFLGDYVDRGTNSLEVICLLFALKIKYPRQVHLIRGNHEDSAINSIYGFKEECKRRLREDPDHGDSCWEKFNKVFEWLPVAALVEDKILCIHGGIGGSIQQVEHLAELQRPLKVSQVPSTELEQRVTDLLWSDPTDNDSMRGVLSNDTRDPDGSGHIVKFGPDRVVAFLQQNKLDLIIRAHECVMDGFERFAGGKLITLFSATDYCGHHKNAGALLFIRRDLTVVPKIIYPPDRADVADFRSTWISLESRPPTPPRSVRRMRDHDLGF